MTNPTSIPSIAKQVSSGVKLDDLKLPQAPTAEVIQWDERNPLTVENHELLSEYVFRWINPKMRERNSMAGWKFVDGDLARAVRRCGVIASLVGGDDSDEMIRNGDLVLGWMPRTYADARRIFYEKKNAGIKNAVTDQLQVTEELKRGKHGRYLNPDGYVSSTEGPFSE